MARLAEMAVKDTMQQQQQRQERERESDEEETAAARALYEACSSTDTPPSSPLVIALQSNKEDKDATAGASINDDGDDFNWDDPCFYEPLDEELGLLPEQYQDVLHAVYTERYGDGAGACLKKRRWEGLFGSEREMKTKVERADDVSADWGEEEGSDEDWVKEADEKKGSWLEVMTGARRLIT
jgi:hypothetical protein